MDDQAREFGVVMEHCGRIRDEWRRSNALWHETMLEEHLLRCVALAHDLSIACRQMDAMIHAKPPQPGMLPAAHTVSS